MLAFLPSREKRKIRRYGGTTNVEPRTWKLSLDSRRITRRSAALQLSRRIDVSTSIVVAEAIARGVSPVWNDRNQDRPPYVVMKGWFQNYGNFILYNGHSDLGRFPSSGHARAKVDGDPILFQNSFRSAALGSIYDFVPWIRSNRRIHFSGVDEYSVTGFSKSRGFGPPLPPSPPPLSTPWFTYEDFFTWLLSPSVR